MFSRHDLCDARWERICPLLPGQAGGHGGVGNDTRLFVNVIRYLAKKGIPKPSGLTDLKVMAIARLMLDNFPHIKAYWQMLGVKIAQVAQSYGADDIDGTVVHETIYHAAGSNSP